MTAASGGPGDSPDYQGGGYDTPPAYPPPGGWQPEPPAEDYPASYPPPPGYAPGYGIGYPPPPPAYPGFPGYPVVTQPRTNVLAIVSLVGSISGVLCFVGSLVGIVTGFIAISQVKRTGERGWGLAVAGVAAGIAGLLLYVVMVASALR